MRLHIIAKSADAIDIQSVYINVTAVSVEEINIQSVHKQSISNLWTYTGEEARPHWEEPEYKASACEQLGYVTKVMTTELHT